MNLENFDLERFEILLKEVLEESASWVEESCGKVSSLSKTTEGVEDTSIHQALTEIDRGLQDRVLAKIFPEFPELVPLVEENTELFQRYRKTEGDFSIILDPIDGTQSFIHGRRDYSSMIGLSYRGKLIYGATVRYHPFNFKSAIVPESPQAKSEKLPAELKLACHYRFLQEPYLSVGKKLEENNCMLAPVPQPVESYPETDDNWIEGPGMGSNGAIVMALLEGRWDAYLAPMVTLHDFAGPWAIAEAAGAVVIQFETSDKKQPEAWQPKTEADFSVENPQNYSIKPTRHRILIARTKEIAQKILEILN